MKKLLLTFLFFGFTIISFSQIDYFENPDSKKDTTVQFERKLNYGFDFGLSFGYVTYISTSLQIAYPVYSWNSVGLGTSVTYYQTRGYTGNLILGGSVFDETYIFKIFIIHAELQIINQTDFINNSRMWNYGIYLGPGYKQKIGQKSYVTYLALWDFNYNDNSVFSNPLFRVSFYF